MVSYTFIPTILSTLALTSKAAAIVVEHTITKTITLPYDQCPATLGTQTSVSYSTAYPVVNVGGSVETVKVPISVSVAPTGMPAGVPTVDGIYSQASASPSLVLGEPALAPSSTGLFSYPGNGNIVPEATTTSIRTLTTTAPDVWVTVTADAPITSNLHIVTSWTLVNGTSSEVLNTAAGLPASNTYQNTSVTATESSTASSTGFNATTIASETEEITSSVAAPTSSDFFNTTSSASSTLETVSSTEDMSSTETETTSLPVEITATSSSVEPTSTSISTSSDTTTTLTLTSTITMTTTVMDPTALVEEPTALVTEIVSTDVLTGAAAPTTISGTDNTDTLLVTSTITSVASSASPSSTLVRTTSPEFPELSTATTTA